MFQERHLPRRRILGSAILVPWLASCRSHPEENPKGSRDPEQDFPIRIGSATFQLQVVVSPEEKARGLMHRKSLAEKHGMLFLSERAERQSFWMKNTWIPLDIGFFSPDGTLLEVRKLYPHVEPSVQSNSDKVLFAVEINRNAYRDAAIEVGAKLNLVDLRAALNARGVDPAKHGL